ncbi:MAG: membrane protease YdiL (CAAX protease family) [Paracoccaceae bacterium]|jgi:membrane protease YdiL (CAAX protease family)
MWSSPQLSTDIGIDVHKYRHKHDCRDTVPRARLKKMAVIRAMIPPAFEAFITPARARPEFWRLLLGLALVVLVYIAWFAGMMLILLLLGGVSGVEYWIQQIARAETPTSALLLLSTFVGLGLGPFLAARILHDRPSLTVLGPMRNLLRHFAIATLICAAIFGLSALIPADYVAAPNLSSSMWLMYLPLALVGVLVQTGAEEILFRGYIQQQLAARFSSPLVWMMVPTVLFALAHYDPQNAGPNTWYVVAATGLFGLAAADLTARTGSLGAAWGFHFANNVFAILIISLDGPLSGLALYSTPFGATDTDVLRPLIVRDMAVTALTWAAIRYAVTRGHPI